MQGDPDQYPKISKEADWGPVLTTMFRMVSIDVTEAACLTHMYNDEERGKLNQAARKLRGEFKKDNDNVITAIFESKDQLTYEEFILKMTEDVSWMFCAP